MNANELADELEDCEPYNVMDTHLFKATATMLRQQQTDLDIALNYIKQYELQIKDLKQQVAFLEDWRDTWSPTIKQLMNINVKVNDGN